MQSRHFYRQRYTRIILSWMLVVALATGFTACKPKQPEQPQELQGGGAGAATWILQQIISGALAYTGSKCMGWLLSLVSGGSGSDQDAADFAQMEGDLTTIINDLNAIQAQLNSLAAQINLDMAKINSNEQSIYMESRESIIDNTYANMQALSATMIGTTNGKTETDLLAKEIITDPGSIDQQLYDIYYAMVGKAAGMQGSALNAFTDVLVAQDLNTGPTDPQVLNRYLALEAYFKQLVQIQLKGAALMVEGLHHRDNPWDNATKVQAQTMARPYGLGDYPGTAEQWMTTKFQPQLEEQVEEFLRCTDRLVLFYSDLRTDITTTDVAVSILPADADIIFSRADFIAAQLSSRHGFGLNVRLAGEPDQIKAMATTGFPNSVMYTSTWNNTSSMSLVPLGLSTDNGYPVRLNPVEQWWFWPDGWTPAYIQWNWGSYATGTSAGTVSGHISFDLATDIAVAKYNQSNPLYLYQKGYVESFYPHETATVGTYDNPVTFMNWYNDDMDIVAAGTTGAHYYGHGTMTIRHRPEPWYQSRSSISGQDVYSGTADCSLGPNPNVRAIAELHQNYYGVDEQFDIFSTIALPIISGMATTQRMTAAGNMQADANNSFHESYMDDSDRITVWWELANEEEGWWAIQLGNPVTYPDTGPHHYFNPGETAPYSIQVELHGNAEGNNGNSLGCRAWPQSMYLFF